ncbi:MAG: hypothetical protein LBF82_02005 [Lactobacillales bacterium]|jgi:hypothetical protein|nr:hypothetical protein [Lactobacillales bacterium]
MKKLITYAVVTLAMFSNSITVNAVRIDCRFLGNSAIKNELLTKIDCKGERFASLLTFLGKEQVDLELEIAQIPFTYDQVNKEIFLTVFIKKNDHEVLGRAIVTYQPTEAVAELDSLGAISIFYSDYKGDISKYYFFAGVQYSLNQSDKKSIQDFLSPGKTVSYTMLVIDPAQIFKLNGTLIIPPSAIKETQVEVCANVITQEDYDAKDCQEEEEVEE